MSAKTGFSCDNRQLMTVDYPPGVLCNDRSGFCHWLQEDIKDTACCSVQFPALPSLACHFLFQIHGGAVFSLPSGMESVFQMYRKGEERKTLLFC